MTTTPYKKRELDCYDKFDAKNLAQELVEKVYAKANEVTILRFPNGGSLTCDREQIFIETCASFGICVR